MLRKHPPGLFIGALGVVAGVAALQAARAEQAASLGPATIGVPTANSQVKQQTLAAAVSNTAFGRGASGGDVGGSARRARSGSRHGHMGGDLHGFVGGNFIPWPFYPYYNYCGHHPADQNC
jgi:hypothetical protein